MTTASVKFSLLMDFNRDTRCWHSTYKPNSSVKTQERKEMGKHCWTQSHHQIWYSSLLSQWPQKHPSERDFLVPTPPLTTPHFLHSSFPSFCALGYLLAGNNQIPDERVSVSYCIPSLGGPQSKDFKIHTPSLVLQEAFKLGCVQTPLGINAGVLYLIILCR